MPTRRYFIKVLSLLFAVSAVVGCTAIRSTRRQGDEGGSGFAYNLPKGLLKFVIVEEVSTPAPIPKAGVVGRTNLTVTNVTTIRRVETSKGPPKVGTDGRLELSKDGENAVTNTITETQSISLDGPSISNLAPTPPAKPTTNYMVSVEVELVPDRKESYLLQMKPSAFADDYIKIGVSNSLIQTVILTNSDQTLTVLSNLTLAAVHLAKYAAMSATDGATIERSTNVFRFDPFIPYEREKAMERMSKVYGTNVEINVDDIMNAAIATNRLPRTPGIFYRQLQPYQVAWRATGGENGDATVLFPNVAPVDSLDVRRATFASQSYLLGIHDGIPYEVTLNKASQVAAVSTLPLTVADSLLSLPLFVTNVLQLKFDVATAKNKLAQADAAALSNQIALIQIRQQLDWLIRSNAASNSPGSGSSNSQPAGGTGLP